MYVLYSDIKNSYVDESDSEDQENFAKVETLCSISFIYHFDLFLVLSAFQILPIFWGSESVKCIF